MFVSRAFDRGLQYAKSGCHYTNPQSVRRVLEYPFLFEKGVLAIVIISLVQENISVIIYEVYGILFLFL